MRRRRASAATILILGLIATTLGWFAFCVQATALDSERVDDAAGAVLDTDAVGDEVGERIATAIQARVPVPVGPAVLDEAAELVLDDPQFREAFGATLSDVLDHVLARASGPIVVDPGVTTDAARRALGALDPAAAGLLTPDTAVTVEVDTDDVPELPWLGVLAWVARLGLLVGAPLVIAGVALSDHRAWALGRVGRWAVTIAVAQLLVFWLLPRLLGQFSGAEVAGAAGMLGEWLVEPALVIAAGGLVLVLIAHRLDETRRRHVLSVEEIDSAQRPHRAAVPTWRTRI